MTLPEIRAAQDRSRFVEGYYWGCVDQNLPEILFQRAFQELLSAAAARIRVIQPNMSREINNRFIDVADLKRHVDIVEVAGAYTTLRKSGKNFSGLCPLHSEDTPSFTVNPDKQIFHCFGCNTGGDVISLLMKLENTDFKGALSILKEN